MIIRVELSGGVWSVSTEHRQLGRGLTRREAIREARRLCPETIHRLPLQPDEIPSELREIARRMLAVGQAVEACQTLESGWPTTQQMIRWAASVTDWADDLKGIEKC